MRLAPNKESEGKKRRMIVMVQYEQTWRWSYRYCATSEKTT